MDPRIWTLLLVMVIVITVNLVNTVMQTLVHLIPKGRWLAVLAVLSFPLQLVYSMIAAVADLLLYQMVAPTFDLPELDLITMLALGWLIGLLVRGATPMRVHDATPKFDG